MFCTQEILDRYFYYAGGLHDDVKGGQPQIGAIICKDIHEKKDVYQCVSQDDPSITVECKNAGDEFSIYEQTSLDSNVLQRSKLKICILQPMPPPIPTGFKKTDFVSLAAFFKKGKLLESSKGMFETRLKGTVFKAGPGPKGMSLPEKMTIIEEYMKLKYTFEQSQNQKSGSDSGMSAEDSELFKTLKKKAIARIKTFYEENDEDIYALLVAAQKIGDIKYDTSAMEYLLFLAGYMDEDGNYIFCEAVHSKLKPNEMPHYCYVKKKNGLLTYEQFREFVALKRKAREEIELKPKKLEDLVRKIWDAAKGQELRDAYLEQQRIEKQKKIDELTSLVQTLSKDVLQTSIKGMYTLNLFQYDQLLSEFVTFTPPESVYTRDKYKLDRSMHNVVFRSILYYLAHNAVSQEDDKFDFNHVLLVRNWIVWTLQDVITRQLNLTEHYLSSLKGAMGESFKTNPTMIKQRVYQRFEETIGTTLKQYDTLFRITNRMSFVLVEPSFTEPAHGDNDAIQKSKAILKEQLYTPEVLSEIELVKQELRDGEIQPRADAKPMAPGTRTTVHDDPELNVQQLKQKQREEISRLQEQIELFSSWVGVKADDSMAFKYEMFQNNPIIKTNPTFASQSPAHGARAFNTVAFRGIMLYLHRHGGETPDNLDIVREWLQTTAAEKVRTHISLEEYLERSKGSTEDKVNPLLLQAVRTGNKTMIARIDEARHDETIGALLSTLDAFASAKTGQRYSKKKPATVGGFYRLHRSHGHFSSSES